MRILNVAQTYHPFLDEGGRPWKVAAMSKELVLRGHEVAVLSADLGLERAFERLGEHPHLERGRAWWRYDHAGIDTYYLDVALRYRVVTLSPGVFPFARSRLLDFDVVHIFGLYDLLGASVAWLAERAGVPYVVEPMGMFKPIVRSVRKKQVYHALLGQRLLARAARVVATADSERDELIAGGLDPSRIVVRRNGLDLSPFAALPPRGAFRRAIGAADDEFLLLFLGRISRKKGIDVLLRGLPHLPARVRLAVIGPDDGDGYLGELQLATRELGLGARVSFHPPRYDRSKLEALVDADLFVLPSQNENFGNAVIESLACGVPALVTDRCGVAQLVEGRAGIVVPYDDDAIRDAVARAADRPDLLAKMRATGPQLARDLSWGGPIEQMIAAYHAVTSRHR